MDQHSEGEAQRPGIPDSIKTSDVFNKRAQVFTQEENTEAWAKAAGMVQTYSDELIKRWKEEIDTYLVFAGLFSAVLTTFNVQSYLLLQPASPDPSIALLQHISVQLGSFSVNPPFINSTVSPNTKGAHTSTAPSPVPRWAVWLNGLWFSGLILSLSSASVGIMVKQWLNEYNSGVSGTSRHVARLRQYRLHNLRKWHVEDIMGAIPVLLQVALACFLAGILIFLWNLHNTVAAIASTLAGALAIFTAATTLLPLYDHSCTYLTPQVYAINSFWSPRYVIYWSRVSAASIPSFLKSLPAIFIIFFLNLRWTLGRLPEQLRKRFTTLASLAASPPEDWQVRKQTWRGRERSIISDLTHALDIQILVEAYASTLHPDAISAASVCVMDFQFHCVLEYFKQLHRSAREHFGREADSNDDTLGDGNQQRLLWLHVLLCAKTANCLETYLPPRSAGHLSGDAMTKLGVYFRTGRWRSNMKASEAEWAMSALSALRIDVGSTGLSAQALLHDCELPEARVDLLNNALRRKEGFSGVVLAGVSGAYLQVRIGELPSIAAMLDREAAFTVHLSNICLFLEIADRALRAFLPPEDLEAVRAYVRDVFTQLTRALPQVPSKDQAHHSNSSTINIWKSDEVTVARFWRLSDDVLRCIPDLLVPDFFRMLDALVEYEGNGSVKHIASRYANAVKEKVISINGQRSGAEFSEASSTGPLYAEAPGSIAPAPLYQQAPLGHPSTAPITTAGDGSQAHHPSRSPSDEGSV